MYVVLATHSNVLHSKWKTQIHTDLFSICPKQLIGWVTPKLPHCQCLPSDTTEIFLTPELFSIFHFCYPRPNWGSGPWGCLPDSYMAAGFLSCSLKSDLSASLVILKTPSLPLPGKSKVLPLPPCPALGRRQLYFTNQSQLRVGTLCILQVYVWVPV